MHGFTRDYLESHIELLAEEVHNAWMSEKLAQGFHAPNNCQNFDPDDVAHLYCDKFERHCEKCHTDLYPYEELPENIKECDRVTVRDVINAMKRLEDEKFA
jgi:hypothetical protein